MPRAVVSFWAIVSLVSIGWMPVFIAEMVRMSSPALDAAYKPQAFAMHWIPITVLCSLGAMLWLIALAVQLVVTLLKGR